MSNEVKESDEKSRRLRERVKLALPVRVHCRETADYEWHEMSHLVDVTPFGARLRLKRPTEEGRLLQLTLAMPRQLRCFDYVEDQYRVWSLVTNVRVLDPETERGSLVEFGVAFVGKHPPRSFTSNPAQRYQIADRSSDLWMIREESDELLAEIDVSDNRKESRLNIPIEVTIDVFADNGAFAESEHTVTENISPIGASVFTTLQLEAGRFVRVSSQQFNVSLVAVVRSHRVGSDHISRLHLQFVGGEWPL